jgi:hypothetical protein
MLDLFYIILYLNLSKDIIKNPVDLDEMEETRIAFYSLERGMLRD